MTLVPANSRGANAVSSVFGRTGVVAAANGDYNGVVASALTGAVAATRYVGGTASGAPVSGTFAVGDFVVEQTGKVFVCTVAGTPGTWVQVGGGGGGFAIGSSYLLVELGPRPQAAVPEAGGFFTWGTVIDSAGADIQVDAMDNTKINLLTSGWYAWGINFKLTTFTQVPLQQDFYYTIPADSLQTVLFPIQNGVAYANVSNPPFEATAGAVQQFSFDFPSLAGTGTCTLDDAYTCVTRLA